jgi:serine/threonine-protein kinase
VDLATLKTALAAELTVLEKLGEGGEGEVFLARQEPDESAAARGEEPRLLALKLLREASGRPMLALALKLRHPHIVLALGTGEVLGRPYVLMEYFPGKPLRTLLTGKPLSPDDLALVFTALADALEHAHAHGVVHQDVKPENVLVAQGTAGLDVKLADFGLAAELRDTEKRALLASRSLRSVPAEELRTLAGTLPYLAPERLEERPPVPHPRIDIYSVGVLLFEALTGQAPAGLELPSELRADLDPAWDRVIKRALARDPSRRHADVAALRREVAPLLRPIRRPKMSEKTQDDMVLIPRGSFRMGSAAAPEARPEHVVSLPEFFIDRTPVTNAAYFGFVVATGARPPSSFAKRGVPPKRLPSSMTLLPVTGVTWEEARAYAAWAGKRLPTEAEWERAARGRSGRAFPYGDALAKERIHTDQKSLGAVVAHLDGASDEGVLDLTGNAWEWCADWFAPYDPSDSLAPTGPSRGEARVIRGGFDPAHPHSGTAWHRGFLRPDVANPRVGFRCARS